MADMRATPDAAVIAVLRTLVRATADQRTPVTLRTRDARLAAALADWLAVVHGSGRIVRADLRAAAEIEVRLPRRMQWPLPPGPAPTGHDGVPPAPAGHHLSRMPVSPTPDRSH